MCVRSVLLLCVGIRVVILLTGYKSFFLQMGSVLYIWFPKYVHSVCWWRLANSAGISHLHVFCCPTFNN